MDKLIDIIKDALGDAATREQKAAAAQACRTVAAALDAEPGQPIATPSPESAPTPGSTPSPLAVLGKLSPDQALDLLIAKLRTAVPDRPQPQSRRAQGFNVQLVAVPRGGKAP